MHIELHKIHAAIDCVLERVEGVFGTLTATATMGRQDVHRFIRPANEAHLLQLVATFKARAARNEDAVGEAAPQAARCDHHQDHKPPSLCLDKAFVFGHINHKFENY